MSTQTYPVDLRNPQVSSNAGNAAFNTVGLTAWDEGGYQFVKAVDGSVFGIVAIPQGLATPNNAKIILQCMANATLGNTCLQVLTHAVGASASFNPASLTAESLQIVAVPGTAYQRFDVTFTLSVTVAANDSLIVQVYHNGTNVSETLAQNLELVGCFLQIDLV